MLYEVDIVVPGSSKHRKKLSSLPERNKWIFGGVLSVNKALQKCPSSRGGEGTSAYAKYFLSEGDSG